MKILHPCDQKSAFWPGRVKANKIQFHESILKHFCSEYANDDVCFLTLHDVKLFYHSTRHRNRFSDILKLV